MSKRPAIARNHVFSSESTLQGQGGTGRPNNALVATGSPHDFLTVDEAASVLRVGRNAVYTAIERGELRGVKRIGKLIRIRRSALLMDEHDYQ